MRRRCFYSIVIIACCIWAAPIAQAQRSDPDQKRREGEIRRAITNLLDGCTGVVRVYPDAINNPKHFETIRVPMTVRSTERHRGRNRGTRRSVTISHARLRAAYPTISPAAYVVFFGADQTDEAVRTVLAECVCVTSYRENSHWTINLRLEDPARQPWWTFVDALGDPIAGASVEIGYPIASPGDSLCLGEVMLDNQGRLRQLKSSKSLIFKLSHPDYGSARVPHQRTPTGEPYGVLFVPLIALDSEKTASSIQGTVLDSEGHPVPGATVRCCELRSADDQQLKRHRRYTRDAVTDDQGWFSLCVPLATKDGAFEGLPPERSRYKLEIQPPRRVSLRQLGNERALFVLAGTHTTFILTPMETKETFHSFSFEYGEGPVTDRDELGNTTLTLVRDGRPWVCLTHEQFNAGYSLPPGILRATTKRWGRSFEFQEVELLPNSPEHIVIRGREPIFYRGQVVNGTTGDPMPRVLVLADHAYSRIDSRCLTDAQWGELREQAQRETSNTSLEMRYAVRNRVTMTDAGGYYEFAFMPGLRRTIGSFVAKAPGHPSAGTYPQREAKGFVEVPTITLSPPAEPVEPPSPGPKFAVETETGWTTDPNKLSEIRLVIRNGRSTTTYRGLSHFDEGRLYAGVYFAEAVWDEKLHIFEPVDLTERKPEVVVFKLKEVRPAHITYQGQVVHGITGQPIGRAIVIRGSHAGRDASGLESKHWAAMKSLGADPDPTDPILAPLWAKVSDHPDDRAGPCTLTDDRGWFRIKFKHPAMRKPESLLILDENFLGVRQQLQLYVDFAKIPNLPRTYEPLVPDENGVVTVGPLKLFPAATLAIQPILSTSGRRSGRERFRLFRTVLDDAKPDWFSDAFLSSKSNFGAGTYQQWDLQPNTSQTVYVLAGVNQRVTLFQPSDTPPPPVLLGQVRLEQGRIMDFGRIEIGNGVEVLARVVDQMGSPVKGTHVVCIDQDGMGRRMRMPTDAEGKVTVKVAAHSTGRLCIFHWDHQTQERFEECTPYAIGGAEDVGREFTLRLSDEMLTLLRAERR